MAGKVTELQVWRHTGHASQTQWCTHLRAQWPKRERDEHPAYAPLEYSTLKVKGKGFLMGSQARRPGSFCDRPTLGHSISALVVVYTAYRAL